MIHFLTILVMSWCSSTALLAQEGDGGGGGDSSAVPGGSLGLVYQNAFGKRWYQNETSLGNEIVLQAMQMDNVIVWEPVPNIPIAVGISHSLFDHSEKSWQSVNTASRIKGWEVGFEIQTYKSISIFQVFMRYRHTLAGEIEIRDKFLVNETSQVVEAIHKVSGFNVDIGGKFKPIGFGTILIFDYSLGFQEYEPQSIIIGPSIENQVGSPVVREKYWSQGVSLGIELPLYP